MISKLLATAIKLYLKSQVSQVQELKVNIKGKNKQILQGFIPGVTLHCERAVYQGLYLSQIELNGADIAINLPEVIKKKPLRLIEPIFVELEVQLDAADLQASLDSALLQSGLSDLWQMILAAQESQELADLKIEWQKIAIINQSLQLSGIYENTSGEKKQILLLTDIDLSNANTLCLAPLNITSESLRAGNLDHQLEIDLGTDVEIQELVIEAEQILCSGKIRINN